MKIKTKVMRVPLDLVVDVSILIAAYRNKKATERQEAKGGA